MIIIIIQQYVFEAVDCWDGPNTEPVIYHGHTLTSKILLKDVIQAVKDFAFCVSKYEVYEHNVSSHLVYNVTRNLS